MLVKNEENVFTKIKRVTDTRKTIHSDCQLRHKMLVKKEQNVYSKMKRVTDKWKTTHSDVSINPFLSGIILHIINTYTEERTKKKRKDSSRRQEK